jgi:predicted NAD/FAD-binding protein
MGYGFHEDGLKAGLNAARQLLADAGARRERPAPTPRVIELEAVAA